MPGERTTAVVTGGGTGLGRSISLRLAREGVDVVVVSFGRSDEVAATLDEIRELGVLARAYETDVSDPAQVGLMARAVLADGGRVDHLVHCAGYTRSVPLEDLWGVDVGEDWDRIFGVNVKGPFLVTREFEAELRLRRGSVVVVSSMSGLITVGSSLPYCASKAANMHLARCLAVAMAPEVRVNSVAPGFMETAWTAALADRKEELAGGALLRRSVATEDVADAVAMLLRNPSITGECLVVDAGSVIR